MCCLAPYHFLLLPPYLRYNMAPFSSFFNNYSNEANLTNGDLEKYTNTKNLLYVSCSRAIENLRILYLDDISEFRDGIESIFGNIVEFES